MPLPEGGPQQQICEAAWTCDRMGDTVAAMAWTHHHTQGALQLACVANKSLMRQDKGPALRERTMSSGS